MSYADTAREGVQLFEGPLPETLCDSVGCPIDHASSREHATGQAVYVDDLPPFQSLST